MISLLIWFPRIASRSAVVIWLLSMLLFLSIIVPPVLLSLVIISIVLTLVVMRLDVVCFHYNIDIMGNRLFLCFLIEEVAEVVAKLKQDFLSIITFVDWLVVIQWIWREEIKFTERKLTLYKPFDFKVWHEVKLIVIHALILIMSLACEVLLQFWLVCRIRSCLHSCNALEL